MSVRKVIAAVAVVASFAVPAYAEEGIGVNVQFAGSVFSSSEDVTARNKNNPGAEQVNGECYYYGHLTPQGAMQYEFGGQAVATSTSQSQPELVVLECTLVSPAQGLAGERPTLTVKAGPIGCPGAACVIGGTVAGWPVRPVYVCIDGSATFGPFPVVEKQIKHACKSQPL